jgi:hypothetical protein
LNALVGSDRFSEDNYVPHWRIEGLVSSTSVVEDIFADDLPVFKVEGFFAKYSIGMK